MNGLDIWGQMPGEDVTPTQSIGLDLNASASNLTFIFNIVNSSFFGAKWGLRYGPGVQGVAAVNTNFTNNAIGVYVTPSALNEAQAQLSVQNSAMDNQVWNVQVETGSSLTHMMYVGNATYLRTGFGGGGLNIKSGGQYTITDNHFTTVQTKFVGTAVLLEGGVGGIVSNNMCIDLLNCIEIKDPSLGYGIRGNVINAGNAAQRAVKNTTALNAPNYITGFQDMAHNYYPNALAVTAAVSQSGAVNGLIQVTTLQDATQLVKDQLVLLTAPGLSNQPAIYRIQQIPDANTVILAGSAFNGSLTSAGALSVVP
jgi:hypothetical protein